MKGGDSESGYKKGLWTEEEDRILMEYINIHGMGKWNRIAQITGLKRCGKSCRLRWMNYLSPNIKRGDFSEEEEDLIIRLHNLLGNRWSLIAGRVPGRTDNQVKNHWNTHLSKKLGFKKGKRPKICNYASRRVMKESSNMTLVEHGCHRALDRRIAENQLQDAVDSEVGAQEPTTSDIFIQTDSVWFINNDEMNLYTPEWVDYVDGHGHGLDFIWDGL